MSANFTVVIPRRAEGANPESRHSAIASGFRVRRFAAPRNDEGMFGEVDR